MNFNINFIGIQDSVVIIDGVNVTEGVRSGDKNKKSAETDNAEQEEDSEEDSEESLGSKRKKEKIEKKKRLKINDDVEKFERDVEKFGKSEINSNCDNFVKKMYTPKKKGNIELSEVYQKISGEYAIGKSVRLKQCSTELHFRVSEVDRKLVYVNSCRVRLCPICQYRRSLKMYRELRIVFDLIKERYPRSKFLFLTLTVKNMGAEDLADSLKHMQVGMQRLFHGKDVKKITLGTVQSLEITYNRESKEYHPHYHVLIHTTSNLYFGYNYIKQKEFVEKWKKALRVDYTPVVDIRVFRPKDREAEGRELAELVKYSVKPSDYLNGKMGLKEKQKVVGCLDNVLNNRRLINFTGTFRTIRRECKMRDQEDVDLIDELTEEEKKDKAIIEIYKWHFGNSEYRLKERVEE